MRFAIWLILASLTVACAPRAAAPANAPEGATVAAAKPSDWKQVEPAKQKVPVVPEPAGLPSADAACATFVAHPSRTCEPQSNPREALEHTLRVSDVLERDDQLSCLEQTGGLPPGLLRALRAELAPTGCADVLALPYLEPRRPELDRRVEDTLIGLAIAGRLNRLVQRVPALPTPFDKPHFMDFFQSALKPWIVSQASAIRDLSLSGARLSPYAKGIVAVEAGLADMRFVSTVRRVPLPREMQDDAEVRDVYYAALDEALEPRKARGRDAALVGLRELAELGVLHDPRVDRARSLLSEIYSGRRIDALDQLLLPTLPAPPHDTVDQGLAAELPAFYAGILLGEAKPDAALLRALLERGVPPAWLRLEGPASGAELRDLLIRAFIERGQRYFRAQDFADAARLAEGDKPDADRALYAALAAALANGPRDASELLLRGPLLPSGAAQIQKLDALASSKNPHAALAEFDAAYLLSLVPPQNDPKFWDQLSARFARAARSLKAPADKKSAQDLAAAAKDTAKSLRASNAKPTAANAATPSP